MLRANVFAAAVYREALSETQLKSLYVRDHRPSRAELVAALSAPERQRYVQLVQRLEDNQREMKAIPYPAENQVWIDLAHALLNMKELIYVQ
jgi:hypothetical protein